MKKLASLDHDGIMEESRRHDRLEYNNEEESKDLDNKSYFESDRDLESKM